MENYTTDNNNNNINRVSQIFGWLTAPDHGFGRDDLRRLWRCQRDFYLAIRTCWILLCYSSSSFIIPLWPSFLFASNHFFEIRLPLQYSITLHSATGKLHKERLQNNVGPKKEEHFWSEESICGCSRVKVGLYSRTMGWVSVILTRMGHRGL